MLPFTHNNMPIDMSIGMGLSPDMKNLSVFGSIPATDTIRQFVWELGGQLADIGKFPATALPIYASSDSSSESVTIRVSYLDTNSEEIVEEIIMNGLTGVQLSNDCRRINTIINISPTNMIGSIYLGTEPTPAGGIPTLSNTMGFMQKDKQISSSLSYSVPMGHTLFVTDFAGGNTRNEENDLTGFFTLGETNVLIQGLVIQLTANYVNLNISYTAIREKSDIIITTQSLTGNNDIVRGRFQGVLVKNSLLPEGF